MAIENAVSVTGSVRPLNIQRPEEACAAMVAIPWRCVHGLSVDSPFRTLHPLLLVSVSVASNTHSMRTSPPSWYLQSEVSAILLSIHIEEGREYADRLLRSLCRCHLCGFLHSTILR